MPVSIAGGDVRTAGLSQTEACRRRVEFGPNALPTAPPKPVWWRFLDQFRSALIYVLVFALLLDLALWIADGADHIPLEALAIGLILFVNAGLGTFQELKAEAALQRLADLSQPRVAVLRDGTLAEIFVRDLVPGDVVRLDEGDRLPADGVLLHGVGLLVDESVLTGESVPVDKTVGGRLSSGTMIVRGSGYVEVTETGPRSAMGRLATLIGTIETAKTPLERRIEQFGRQIAIVVLAIGAVLTLGGVAVEGVALLGGIVLFSVALAVAAVPEGLPAIMALTLALGVERLARVNAVIRRLSAVEALGSVTVIATDKTGTMTENRMEVRAIETPARDRALRAMVFANDAEHRTGAGDPLDAALLAFATVSGTDVSQLIEGHPRISSRPFDSRDRFMRVTVRDGDGAAVSYLKGAPEVLIARSDMAGHAKRQWEARALERAGDGYRVIALATAAGAREDGLEFLGLVMLWDPPRPEVGPALAECRAAGIRVLMITGDHPATAAAVGRTLGIEAGQVMTGGEVAALSAAQLREAVMRTSVFARVAPEHKLAIVEALKANGEIVAVTGDGVNDAPALKRADVGVAMGKHGSDVSREVADIVLLDDNFATIVRAVGEGRSITENIQTFIRVLVSTNLALVVLMVAGLGFAAWYGLREPGGATFLLPLTAAQLLWINVVAEGPPALALALDRRADAMRQPPRPPDSGLIDGIASRFILVAAGVKIAFGLAFFALLAPAGWLPEVIRTALFLFISLNQLVLAYPARRASGSPLPNPWLHGAIWIGVLLQLATIMVPALRTLLGLAPLDWQLLALVVAAVLLSWVLTELLAVGRTRSSANRHEA